MELALKYFNSHIIKSDGCWSWIGYNNGRGYGKFRIGKLLIYAHRFSYEKFNGPIPKGKFVLHKCDNPTCVNPSHLEVGTQKKNMRDCVNRRRAYMGERCNLAKITAKGVNKIRKEYSQFMHKKAKEFKLTPAQISNIVNMRSWR